jgi:hypothetical protein
VASADKPCILGIAMTFHADGKLASFEVTIGRSASVLICVLAGVFGYVQPLQAEVLKLLGHLKP